MTGSPSPNPVLIISFASVPKENTSPEMFTMLRKVFLSVQVRSMGPIISWATTFSPLIIIGPSGVRALPMGVAAEQSVHYYFLSLLPLS